MDDDDGWDSYAAGWDQDEGARAYASAAFASLQQVLQTAGIEMRGARAIDFGCGTGLLTERLVAFGVTVVAVDTSEAMLAVLDEKVIRRGWTDVTTSSTLPPLAEPVDLIVCSSVCSFLEDYPGTVVELTGRLRPGGVFVQWDWEREPGDDEHGLSRQEITAALDGAGLERIVVDTGFVVTIGGATMRPLIGHGRRPLPATPPGH